MKRFLSLFMAAAVVAFIYSCEDPVDTDNIDVSSVPPTIESFSPEDGATPLKGDTFDIEVTFADGEVTPLQSATITLWDGDSLTDPNLTQLAQITPSISGESATVTWAGADFEAFNLDTAVYIVTISVSDTEGATTESNFSFEVVGTPFPTMYPNGIFMMGSFNGWDGAALEDKALELTGPGTWVIDSVTLASGDGFKFSDSPDFSGSYDFSDPDCDMELANFQGPGNDTFCGYDGTFTVTFIEGETLGTGTYSLENISPPDNNIDGLFLTGSFNNFRGSEEYEFRIDTNNTWILDEVLLEPGDLFFFSEAADLSQDIWGDNEPDSIADSNGESIMIPNDFEEGFYKITFLDNTRRYYVQFLRGLTPSTLYLVGGSTGAGWDSGNALPFEEYEEDKWRIFQYVTVEGDGFKFLPTQESFDGDYGDGGSGAVVQEGESNATVSEDGFYKIEVDFVNNTWSATKSSWGVVGAATPGGWPSDDNPTPDAVMALASTTKGETTWTVDLDLTAGPIKFRENLAWDFNFGDDGADGSLERNGSDINVAEAGNYTIAIDLAAGGDYTYTLTRN